jgi:methylenetetrahydrofolate reductase (NADPH)
MQITYGRRLQILSIYTMNLEAAVVKIIKEPIIIKMQKELPFKKITSTSRQSESDRPIFWANKPTSYVQRTLKYDEIPNGRWGNRNSPAFGEGFENKKSYGRFVSYAERFKSINLDEKRKFWVSTCRSLKDLSKIFMII